MAAPTETIRVRLNYPLERVKQPILYHLIRDFGLVPNLYRANIDVHLGGYIVLELTGAREALARGLEWVETLGVVIGPADEEA